LLSKILNLIPLQFFAIFLLTILVLQLMLGLVSPLSLYLLPFYICLGISIPIITHRLVLGQRLSIENLKELYQISFSNSYIHFQIKAVIIEEFIWRFLPVVLIKPIFEIEYGIYLFAFISLVFIYQHFYYRREIHLILLLEFSIYFITLSIAFYFWSDFIMIVILHFLRNAWIIAVGTLKKNHKYSK
jgi:hypothetical protein